MNFQYGIASLRLGTPWFLFVFFFSFLHSSTRVKAAPTIDEIRRTLDEFQAKTDSIKVVFDVRFTMSFDLNDIEDKPSQEWTWVRSGRKQLFKNDLTEGLDRKQFVRVWMSFDGSIGYVLSYHRGDNTILRMIDETPHEPDRFATSQFLQAALGWVPIHSNTKESVNSLLRKSINSVVTEETIDGDRCARVRLGEIPSGVSGGPSHEVTVWLSESHDYCPKRISVFPVVAIPSDSKDAIQLPAGSMPDILDVVEYREVTDALFQKNRWFPQRIQHRSVFSHEIEVKTITLNEPVPAGTFIPDKPIGTEIRRWMHGTAKSRSSFVGGEEGEKLFNERLRIGEAANLKPTVDASTGVDASPTHGLPLSVWFGTGSLLIFGLAIVAAKRRSG